jgi:hypothetical protein
MLPLRIRSRPKIITFRIGDKPGVEGKACASAVRGFNAEQGNTGFLSAPEFCPWLLICIRLNLADAAKLLGLLRQEWRYASLAFDL